MSDTAQQAVGETGAPPGRQAGAGGGLGATLMRALRAFARQREATVFVVAVALFLYFAISQGIGLHLEGEPGHAVLRHGGAHHHHRAGRGLPADLRRDRPVGGLRRRVRPLPHALPDRLLRLPRPAGHAVRAAVRAPGRLGERLLHGHGRRALVHHHAGHRVHPAGAHQHDLSRPAGEHPAERAGHRQVARHLRVGADHLGGRAHDRVPHRADPDPLGPVHGLHGREPARGAGGRASA